MATPCYLLEITDLQHLQLRRFVFGIGPHQAPDQEHRPCRERPTTQYGRGGCDASSPYLEERPIAFGDEGTIKALPEVPRDDPRWPTACAACGCAFDDRDHWQTNGEPIYRVAAAMPGAALDVDAETTLELALPGAMWRSDWMPDNAYWRGPDSHSLMVRLPDGHDWHVDGEASNCTRKGDLTHKCWVRHGVPPNVTVGKNGETCAAGMGSIQSPGYHGFLREGVLT